MTIQNKKMMSTAIIATVFMTACAANTSVEADVASSETLKSSASQDYIKPGAAVSYSHNLGSKFEANETVTFQLSLQESYTQGALNVSLTSEGGVQLYAGSTGNRFDMASGNEHVMDISFTATSEGRHYINVQAMADDGSGQVMPRTFSIPVQIGQETAMKPNDKMEVTTSGDNIIVMDAEETVK